MELSTLYHNARPEGELLPQEAAAFTLLEELGMDYDRVSSEPADTMEKCAAVSEVLGMPICKNLFPVSYTHLTLPTNTWSFSCRWGGGK